MARDGVPGSGRGDEEAMRSSQPHARPLTPDQHFRDTVPAPNAPVPPAAKRPVSNPNPELGALPRPPRLPGADPVGPPPASKRPTTSPRGASRSVRPNTSRPRPAYSNEPSVLLVGAPDSLVAALEPALNRRHIHIERCTNEDVSEFVAFAAPDLVVLAGDAATDAGHHVLRALANSPQTSVVPVAILDDNEELETRLRAFRHGAAAVIPRSASMDEMAERISTVAREIPERESELLGDIGESTLEDLINALGQELRTGILSVRSASGSEKEAVRVVLGGGRALSATIDEFVRRVREHVVTAEPLRYEFDERAGGTVQLIGSEGAAPPARSDVAGMRIVLADDDTARADDITRELRDHGVEVVVTDLNPSDVRFLRIRTMDPAILLIGEQQAQGAGYEFMRRMRRDTRLRWASLLVVRWNEVWSDKAPVPAVERILGTLATLAEPEHALHERAESRVAFDTRLEITGPARLLRALANSSKPLRVTVQNPRVTVRVDVSEGLIVGAHGETHEAKPRELSGPTALAALLLVSSGRVHVEPTEQPAVANLMATPDVALNLADAEPPPIVPSLPIPAPLSDAHPAEPMPRLKPARSEKRGSHVGGVLYAFFALIAIVALGGGALVGGRYYLQKRAAERAPPKETAPIAVATASAGAPVEVEPSAAPSGSAAPSASAKATPAPSGKPVKPEVERPGTVSVEEAEGLVKAPTCESFHLPPAYGVYPGAAYDSVRIARKAMVRGDNDAAEGAYCRALRYDPKNPDATAGLARLLLIRRDAIAGIQWARDAVKLSPDDKQMQLLLGDALALAGELQKAAEPIVLGSGLDLKDVEGRKKLAAAMLRIGNELARKQDMPGAERSFRRAIVLDPKNVEAALGVARILLDIGQPKASAHWAKKATQLDPRSAAPYVALGDALVKAGDQPGATAAYKKALAVEPNDSVARGRVLTTE